MSSIDQRWKPIETLTSKMMKLAEEGEWEEIAALELARRALIESFFEIPVSPDEASEVSERIHSLLAQDKTMMNTGTEASAKILGEIQVFSTGRKAQQAYSEHS